MLRRFHPLLALLVVLAAAGLFVAASAGGDSPRKPAAAQNGNPLEGMDFFVDKQYPGYGAWRRASGRKKALLAKIALPAKNIWFGAFTRPASQFRAKVRRPIDAAEAEGSLPLLTVLRAESTQCHRNYQAGGPKEDRLTREWYDKFAAAIGDSRVVVAFEPDSLGTIDCHAPSRRDDRRRLLRYGVNRLADLPNTTVYIEAGASDWFSPARAARLLRQVGVGRVRGFMLNATHYDWIRNNIRHGVKISRRLGGKHFVINTAKAGRGPVHYRRGNRRINIWCEPGLRGLGKAPTTDTSHPLVDAYLWINRPGFNQSCGGRKIAWNTKLALRYARFATNWEKPPRGTRLGHHKRYPRRAFGIP
jgi:endoglucanase